ncbi:hypothetical protein ACSVMW_001874 [Vibrio parahaemolyticus]
MALEMNQDTPFGIELNGAYLRVDFVTIIDKVSLRFALRTYNSRDAAKFIDENFFACEYDINGENPYKQAYDHLKSLEEFNSAVDV